MALTFLNIQDQVIEYGYGSNDRDRIKNWINRCYRDIASRYRWTWTQDSISVSTTADQATTTLSTSIDHWGRLRPAEEGLTVPQFVDWHSFNNDFIVIAEADLDSGVPLFYSLWDSKIYWNPIPDDTYSYTAECWIVPTDLSADANEPLIPATDRDVLVMGACMHAATRDKDWTAAAYWQGQYEGMIAKMKAKTNMRQTETPRRVPMPEEYGGMFG